MRRHYTDDRDRITLNVAVDEATGCWNWLLNKKSTGYGLIGCGSRQTRLAHRLAYQLFVGPIPDGLTLDHICSNRGCVNPDHLEPVTQRENSHRSPRTLNSVNAAKTHCPQNHPYSPDNTYIVPSTGGRMCRICIRKRASRQAPRSAAA